MITLSNVSKIYKSKSGQQVRALNKVSFVLSNNGMTFILGKSGSGKSTLLNLLGGLDVPTEGKITVEGASLGSLTQADLDAYRNSYVGFVFQEYNLLEDMSVKENITLALTLSKDTNVELKVANALRQVELSEDYLTRRINELSGGEKQRVAIARSIVKDSKLILADEPTGNLDSATGESIWKILKKLSETKLVVVVSHDRESAERFADRTIEIADGEVKRDSHPQSETTARSQFAPRKLRLPFVTRIKLAWQSLFKRKFRAISAIILAIFGTVTLVIVQMLLSFDRVQFVADMVNIYDVPSAVLWQRTEEGQSSYYCTVKQSSRDFLAENCDYFLGEQIRNKQQLLNMGCKFIGEAAELDSHSFYITSSYLDYIVSRYADKGYAIVSGKEVPLSQFDNDHGELVGKQVYFPDEFNYESGLPVLSGIVDSSVEGKNVYMTDLGYIFALENFEHWYSYRLNSMGEDISDTLAMGDKLYNGGFELASKLRWTHGVLIGDGLVVNEDEYPIIGSGEVMINFELYSKLFDDAKSLSYYVTEELGNYSREDDQPLPEHLGETIHLKLLDIEGGLLYDMGPLKRVGVVLLQANSAVYMNIIDANRCMAQLNESVTVGLSSVDDIVDFLRQAEEHGLEVRSIGTVRSKDESVNRDVEEISELLEDAASHGKWIFGILGGVLLFVLIMIVINIISLSVASRKRETGILTALGMSRKDTVAMFLYETLIISVIGFVGSIVLSLVASTVINACLLSQFVITIPFLHFGWLSAAIIAIVNFALLPLATLLPLGKIIKMQPADAIRAL